MTGFGVKMRTAIKYSNCVHRPLSLLRGRPVVHSFRDLESSRVVARSSPEKRDNKYQLIPQKKGDVIGRSQGTFRLFFGH